MDTNDYYDVLGCTKESTHEDLKRAYHALAKRYHPDKHDSVEVKNSSRFQYIVEAWNALRHPESRREYDVRRKQMELDSENVSVYATVSIDELKATDNTETMTYPCRCGSNYEIHAESLLDATRPIYVPCDECSFVIIVV